ncbi:hypothetical protein O5173_25860, partial [Escherichia coli]|nr:hypothetical protein [Escherichia coli]
MLGTGLALFCVFDRRGENHHPFARCSKLGRPGIGIGEQVITRSKDPLSVYGRARKELSSPPFRPCRLPDTCPPFSLREAWRFL